MVLGTTLRAVLFIAAIWAAALWALVLGELVYLHVVAAPPVWLMLAWWLIPILVGACVVWAIHTRRTSEET